MRKLKLLLPFFFIFIIFSCNKETKLDNIEESPTTITETSTYEQNVEDLKQMHTGGGLMTPEETEDIDPTNPTGVTDETVVSDEELKQIGKKLIKTANISFETKKYEDFVTNVKKSLKDFDAYIDSESETNYSGVRSNTIIIRVKSSQFDSLLNLIFEGEATVTSKSIKVQDVTAEYVDVYQHLKSQMLVKQRYEDILKKAHTVNDILSVTQYLNQTDIQIDNLKGKLKYLGNQSQYSTITLYISEKNLNAPKNQFWEKVGEAIFNGWKGLQYFLVIFISLWPLWIITIIIIFVVIKLRKKKQTK